MSEQKFVVKTTHGYFQCDLHCVAHFTEDKSKAASYKECDAKYKAGFLKRMLDLKCEIEPF